MSAARRATPSGLRTRRRGGVLAVAALLAMAGAGCSSAPVAAPAVPQDVDYLGVYSAYDEAYRTLELATPSPADAAAAQDYLGWGDESPYALLQYDPAGDGSLTMCASEKGTSRYVTSITGPQGKGTVVLFSPDACAESVEESLAAVEFPAGAAPGVPKDSPDIESVISYLAGHRERLQETTAVARTVKRLGDRLGQRHEQDGAYPGVAAAEIAAELDVQLHDGVEVRDYLSTGADADLCVVGTAGGSWAHFQASQRAVVRSGVAGGDCNL